MSVNQTENVHQGLPVWITNAKTPASMPVVCMQLARLGIMLRFADAQQIIWEIPTPDVLQNVLAMLIVPLIVPVSD
jgi:hypothetical protein